MKLTFLGAARTTTGSMHVVEANGLRLLLDCGLYQGHRKESFERNRRPGVDAATLDAVLLSHAHIDHSGNLPTLARQGFRGTQVRGLSGAPSHRCPGNLAGQQSGVN